MRLFLVLVVTLLAFIGGDSHAVRAGFPGRMGPPAVSQAAYSAEAEALFAAFTTPPSEARKAIINAAVTSLISAGLWSKLDCLQVYAAADAQAGRVDWRAPSRVATEVNSPTFTADRGYTGNGSSSYVDSGFNASMATVYLQTSNSIHVYVNDGDSAQTVVDMGNTSGSIGTRNASNNIAYRNSALGTNNTVATVPSALGLTTSMRNVGGTFMAYKDAVFIENLTRGSAPLVNINVFVGAQNLVGTPTLFSTRRVAMIALGGYLSEQELTDFRSIMLTYLTAIGAN